MMAKSHVPFALSCWWIYALALGYPITAENSLAAAMGGLLPDLDHPKSALGRRLPFLSIPLAALFGHRGFTHSLLAVGVVLALLVKLSLASPHLNSDLSWLIVPVSIGYLSHLLGDSFTPSGVPLLYPKKTPYSFNLFKTNDIREFVLVGLLTLSLLTFGGIAPTLFYTTLDRVTNSLRVGETVRGW